ncbi:hypothetical protein BHM03_00003562 [Ensete ventricosum]|nr:hypothetical protein BHM03_00003562 [Ensete ventricosum]
MSSRGSVHRNATVQRRSLENQRRPASVPLASAPFPFKSRLSIAMGDEFGPIDSMCSLGCWDNKGETLAEVGVHIAARWVPRGRHGTAARRKTGRPQDPRFLWERGCEVGDGYRVERTGGRNHVEKRGREPVEGGESSKVLMLGVRAFGKLKARLGIRLEIDHPKRYRGRKRGMSVLSRPVTIVGRQTSSRPHYKREGTESAKAPTRWLTRRQARGDEVADY